MTNLILALGANVSGPWGQPLQTLRRAVRSELPAASLKICSISALYETAPVGVPARQPRYLNAIAIVHTTHAPARVLAMLKNVERRAGRRRAAPGSARPLDIDIIDDRGRVIGWPPGRRRARLVLPHPEAHRRAFVLVPLSEIHPAWRHPCLGVSALTLLKRLRRWPGDVRRKLDSGWVSCQEGEV